MYIALSRYTREKEKNKNVLAFQTMIEMYTTKLHRIICEATENHLFFFSIIINISHKKIYKELTSDYNSYIVMYICVCMYVFKGRITLC